MELTTRVNKFGDFVAELGTLDPPVYIHRG